MLDSQSAVIRIDQDGSQKATQCQFASRPSAWKSAQKSTWRSWKWWSNRDWTLHIPWAITAGHKSKIVQEWCSSQLANFWPWSWWPPSSPDYVACQDASSQKPASMVPSLPAIITARFLPSSKRLFLSSEEEEEQQGSAEAPRQMAGMPTFGGANLPGNRCRKARKNARLAIPRHNEPPLKRLSHVNCVSPRPPLQSVYVGPSGYLQRTGYDPRPSRQELTVSLALTSSLTRRPVSGTSRQLARHAQGLQVGQYGRESQLSWPLNHAGEALQIKNWPCLWRRPPPRRRPVSGTSRQLARHAPALQVGQYGRESQLSWPPLDHAGEALQIKNWPCLWRRPPPRPRPVSGTSRQSAHHAHVLQVGQYGRESQLSWPLDHAEKPCRSRPSQLVATAFPQMKQDSPGRQPNDRMGTSGEALRETQEGPVFEGTLFILNRG